MESQYERRRRVARGGVWCNALSSGMVNQTTRGQQIQDQTVVWHSGENACVGPAPVGVRRVLRQHSE